MQAKRSSSCHQSRAPELNPRVCGSLRADLLSMFCTFIKAVRQRLVQPLLKGLMGDGNLVYCALLPRRTHC